MDNPKLLKIELEPIGLFRTPLKGDTIFGHVCWEIAYDGGLTDGGIDSLVSQYRDSPLLIVSSAIPKIKGEYYLPKPLLPDLYWAKLVGAVGRSPIVRKKEAKKRLYVKSDLKGVLDLRSFSILSKGEEDGLSGDKKESGIVQYVNQPHNSINRATGTTDTNFTPFSQKAFFYRNGVTLAVLCLYDPDFITEDSLKKCFENIGIKGYGADSSTGSGRFNVLSTRHIDLPDFNGANGLVALSPVCLGKAREQCYYEPFLRIGKHWPGNGQITNPFKAPIEMFDDGSVVLSDTVSASYMGEGLSGDISKAIPQTIHQGYSITWPINVDLSLLAG